MIPRDALLAEIARALRAARGDSADDVLRQVELRVEGEGRASLSRTRLLEEVASCVRDAFPQRAREILVALQSAMWPHGVLGPVDAPAVRPCDLLDLEPEDCASLVVVEGESRGLRLLLHLDSMTLGRAGTDVDFALPESTVAQRHVLFTQDATGGVLLEDLGAAYGLYVNGKRTSESWVNDGDEVRCGALALRFIAPR